MNNFKKYLWQDEEYREYSRKYKNLIEENNDLKFDNNYLELYNADLLDILKSAFDLMKYKDIVDILEKNNSKAALDILESITLFYFYKKNNE